MPKTPAGLHYETLDLRPAWRRHAGRPVVFHHGVGASLEIFDAWLPVVAARHPVARFDMRGFGRSPVPPEDHKWTMGELIDDLLAVAEGAFGREPVHVMGESIGGTIALAAGLAQPRRIASVAMSNAAINGGHIGYAPGWRGEVARIGVDGWSRRLMEMRFAPGSVSPDLLEWFAQVQGRSHAHVVVGLGELLVGTDLTDRLAGLEVPLLMMLPDRSPFVSLSQASSLAEVAPHADIAVFPGARHGLPLSHAREAAATLAAFLERVEAGQPHPPRFKRT
ncbi:MAG TPA: alpha/beta fold hydrolase [Hyphomicrobiaceae bacterium]|nr:alpha/beta fold hydrolase [Hyphomicrobiaceae bacterium]